MKDYPKLKFLNIRNKKLLLVRRNTLKDTKKYRDEVRELISNSTYDIICEIYAYRLALDIYLESVKTTIFLRETNTAPEREEKDPNYRALERYYQKNYPKQFSRSYKLPFNDITHEVRAKMYKNLKLVHLKRTSIKVQDIQNKQEIGFKFEKDMELLLENDIRSIKKYYAMQVIRKHNIPIQNAESYINENMSIDSSFLLKRDFDISSSKYILREEIINEYEIFKTKVLHEFINDIS
jgi:hypothetical protein